MEGIKDLNAIGKEASAEILIRAIGIRNDGSDCFSFFCGNVDEVFFERIGPSVVKNINDLGGYKIHDDEGILTVTGNIKMNFINGDVFRKIQSWKINIL